MQPWKIQIDLSDKLVGSEFHTVYEDSEVSNAIVHVRHPNGDTAVRLYIQTDVNCPPEKDRCHIQIIGNVQEGLESIEGCREHYFVEKRPDLNYIRRQEIEEEIERLKIELAGLGE